MNCPASHKAELAAGDVPEDTRDADEGQDVHSVLSDDLSADDVSYSAAQTAEMCEAQVQQLLREWPECFEEPRGYKEIRYGLTDIGAVMEVHEGTKANFLFTGQLDALYVCGPHGLLIDFKALHGKHASAVENPQLMGLAVLVAKRHKLMSLRVALVQPWKGKPTVADYGAHGLELAASFLTQVLEAERDASPYDRKAGDHCKFCKARFTCHTLRDSSINALDIVQPETLPADPSTRNKAIFARVDDFTPTQSLHIEKNVKGFLRAFLAAHDAKFRKFVEDGEMPGHILREKSGRRKIVSVGTAYERAASHGVTAEAFAAKCSLSLKGLNEAIKDATKAKGKALEAIADEVLHGICDTGKPTFEVVEIAALE
jgi:hypothetical protein